MTRRLGPGTLLAGLGLALLLPLAWLISRLPPRVGLWLGRRLGDAAWVALPRRRAITRDNLARAFGEERSAEERRALARSSYQHLGMNLVEVCILLLRPLSVLLSRVELHGRHHLEAAAAQGRGVLLLTAHLGNWELLPPAHARTGLSLSIVVRPLDLPLLDRIAERYRQGGRVELIAKRHALRSIVEALRRGRMVGVLLDQNAARSEGVFAPLFGIPASTSKGLAVISLRTGAPVVPTFIRRIAGGRHRVEFEPQVAPPPDQDVAAFTASFNRSIEQAIRRAPEQWFWMHERWRTRPRAEAS
jgi:KDO2-lipid IV(A) lauroyltransferase